MLNSNSYRFLSLLWFYILFPEEFFLAGSNPQHTGAAAATASVGVAAATASVGVTATAAATASVVVATTAAATACVAVVAATVAAATASVGVSATTSSGFIFFSQRSSYLCAMVC